MTLKKPDSLKKYRARRDFQKTPEPAPKVKVSIGKRHLFVVQKHAARSLHYDFRLEIDGVLVSWAVPKGFSLNPSVKHLAVQTEDHPYAYARFEGVIPAGEYGAGTVMVWDIGTYQALKLEPDRVEVVLHGKKLEGGFALIKMKGRANQWLLVKMDDEYANRTRDTLPKSFDKSALSGRTMTQIKKEETP